MSKCEKCGDTGVVKVDDINLAPCDCPARVPAIYHVGGVEGEVTLTELCRHFYPDCPEPLRPGVDIKRAEDLPGRRQQ